MGSQESDATLRETLAIGADQALILDPRSGSSRATMPISESSGVATQVSLAKVIYQERSINSGGDLFGTLLAGFLRCGYAHRAPLSVLLGTAGATIDLRHLGSSRLGSSRLGDTIAAYTTAALAPADLAAAPQGVRPQERSASLLGHRRGAPVTPKEVNPQATARVILAEIASQRQR